MWKVGGISHCITATSGAILALGLAPSASSSENLERQRRQCDAVLSMSEIDYDSSIILNLARDDEKDICSFYVSLPPNGKKKTAESEVFVKLSSLWKRRTEEGFIDFISESNVSSDIQQALLSPLNSDIFIESNTEPLMKAIESNYGFYDTCIADSFLYKKEFRSIGENVSCGILWPELTFSIVVAASPMSVDLQVPIIDN